MHILRTDSTNPDFQKLVKSLDATLAEHNGENDDFFSQYNKIDTIKNCVVVYIDDIPAACGAFKPFSEDTVEIKRMFTDPEFRKKGLGSAIVKELENWAAELNFEKAVLETSQDLKSAISVYEKNGFYRIPNYGQYIGIEQSVCYEKEL
ncbi:GNAT family N-acetyltransferase [Chryseobacterium sp. D764]|jgi:GNAT superfamily N-acetyltransferase|uniref:GNAT family N-acetyltransferase n=1 Tax=unclassified Chryseobacterium TaxID=2593645 RepID=UPI000985F601|nr:MULTISPECIES: GNAT family N-acetyltransferase [unclassified Chryseobacterium]QXU48679.1 GNAT family N-acetyltransferase [Chryseobacterium sp. D764]CAD0223463.1 GNAT family N-acetyltransferase [Chryseobacterium sp. JV274]